LRGSSASSSRPTTTDNPAVSRLRRVNESLRAVVAEGVRDLKDPRIGLVTVTAVSVTPDLREATVYVSVLGGEPAHAVLQAKIGRELSLRRTPTLTFAYDDSVERGVRMTKLIDELTAELPLPEDGAEDG